MASVEEDTFTTAPEPEHDVAPETLKLVAAGNAFIVTAPETLLVTEHPLEFVTTTK